MAAHDAVEVILAKRDGGRLTDSQIDWTIRAYTDGEIADEQMSALAMAILLNGMDRAEISRWTAAMIASGERMDFSSLRRADGSVILSPTPPVECLSAVDRDSPEKSIRSPDAIIASVQRAISERSMPLSRIAIARADICSSATTPRV